MNKFLLILAVLALFFTAGVLFHKQPQKLQLQQPEENLFNVYLADIADYVNGLHTSWRAKTYTRWGKQNYASMKNMMGALDNPRYIDGVEIPVGVAKAEYNDLPTEFFSQDKWTYCPSITEIRDQANCGSCWAVAAGGAMSDRHCIVSKDSVYRVSYQNIVSCCPLCGFGCNGGYTFAAWNYWWNKGICDGDKYEDFSYCQPYTIPACGLECPSTTAPTPACLNLVCNEKYTGGKTYAETVSHGKSVTQAPNNMEYIMNEIMTNGPVEAGFTVYEDFMAYEGGVYQHTTGKAMGGHAVKIYGWGHDDASGLDYWLIANSWSNDWGENGSFKMVRGTNNCGIESQVVFGQAA